MKFNKTLGAMAAVAALLAAGTTLAGSSTPTFTPRLKIKSLLALALPVQHSTPVLGDALLGLTPDQLKAFTDGREEFTAVETPEGGLGPIFNDSSCGACHTAGGIGGASTVTVTRFGRVVNGKYDPLDSEGGSLLQAKAIDPEVQEHIPASANLVVKRITTPLFGAGLIEAIDDLTIQLNALLPRGDGVTGRVSMVTDITTGKQRVGRFGWKAQQATLLAFAGDAYLNEMGVTSRFFPTENAPNGNKALLAKWDKVPDIEDTVNPATGKGDIDAAADFMRYLAPPVQQRATASSLAGGLVFAAINCTACHTPVMFTGYNKVAALSFKAVPLFSDLLLHDMGSLGDGIAQAAAEPYEMRTPPLWGLASRPAYLHDGRATTVDAAIRAHAGEGAAAQKRYVALPTVQRQQLLDFLNSN